MRCRHKNGLSADAVHVDAHARLAVVQVNVTVLGDQVGNTVLVTYLNSVKKNNGFNGFMRFIAKKNASAL
jgi:hypothetical protein